MITRKDIIQCAHKLFNEKGYNQTAMRDISKELHISVGNLTYYYKKKQDILIDVMNDEFISHMHCDNISSLQDLDMVVNEMLNSVQHNSFYFNDPQLIVSVPEVEENHHRNIEGVKRDFYKCIEALVQLGIMECKEDEIHALIELLMFAHIGWIQKNIHCSKEQIMKYQWMILGRYITKDYKDEWEKIIRKYGDM